MVVKSSDNVCFFTVPLSQQFSSNSYVNMASLKYNTYLNIAYVTAGAEKKTEKLLIVTLILGENIFFFLKPYQ